MSVRCVCVSGALLCGPHWSVSIVKVTVTVRTPHPLAFCPMLSLASGSLLWPTHPLITPHPPSPVDPSRLTEAPLMSFSGLLSLAACSLQSHVGMAVYPLCPGQVSRALLPGAAPLGSP